MEQFHFKKLHITWSVSIFFLHLQRIFFLKYIFNFKNHKLIGKKPNNKFENFIKN
jgi:hypothetical protein